jgi:hypothetical protein
VGGGEGGNIVLAMAGERYNRDSICTGGSMRAAQRSEKHATANRTM